MNLFKDLSNRQTNQLANNKLKGDFEPLVGREWSDKKGPGQKTSFGGIALKPGSKFGLHNDDIKVIIGKYGNWEFEGCE